MLAMSNYAQLAHAQQEQFKQFLAGKDVGRERPEGHQSLWGSQSLYSHK